MSLSTFSRFSECVNKKEDKKVVSVTVAPTLSDCSGAFYITDIQLQEGPLRTGYAPHTEGYLAVYEEDGEDKDPIWYNGVIRGEQTVVIPNRGDLPGYMDIHLYPTSDMEESDIEIAHGYGGQKASFPYAVPKDSDLALLGSTRECTLDGEEVEKVGFYSYSAAYDTKHRITIPDGAGAVLLFTIQEMTNGEDNF